MSSDAADNYVDINTITLTVAFLATYFIIYAIVNMIFGEDDHNTKASFVDVIFLVLFVVACFAYYYSLDSKHQDSFWADLK